ncbi:uncharacterized protein [Dermacentor albipictus]|uniref:uncharacterized protein n=1 Tax=Dermacentor albipictus TaxID=60249 RepID=UPI0031FBF849
MPKPEVPQDEQTSAPDSPSGVKTPRSDGSNVSVFSDEGDAAGRIEELRDQLQQARRLPGDTLAAPPPPPCQPRTHAAAAHLGMQAAPLTTRQSRIRTPAAVLQTDPDPTIPPPRPDVIRSIADLQSSCSQVDCTMLMKPDVKSYLLETPGHMYGNTEKLFDELVRKDQLKYLLTQNLSQDDAENLFGSIRARGGHNNNPTAAQFKAAYKRLLVQTEVTSSISGNCSQDIVSILNPTTTGALVGESSMLTDMRRSSILQADDHNYTHRIGCPESLSAFVGAVVPYIAGFVVQKVRSTVTCELCIAALPSDELAPLIRQKSRGGLISASQDVVGLCEAVEKGLRWLQAEYYTIKMVTVRSKHLILEVLGTCTEKNWFQKLEDHILDLDPLDNHIYILCKKIAEKYIKVTIHHMTKERNRELIKNKVRPLLSRVIIFNHQ